MQSRKRAGDGFTHDTPFVVDVSCVLGNHDHFVRIHGMVGIQVAFIRIQAVLAQSGSGIIEHLITVIHLARIQHTLPRSRIRHVHTFYGPQLVFVRAFPGYRLFPVQIRSHRIPELVLLYLVGLVACVCRIGQAFADNRVAHPKDKLAIFGIRHFIRVHPEAVDRNFPGRNGHSPQRIGFFRTDLQ